MKTSVKNAHTSIFCGEKHTTKNHSIRHANLFCFACSCSMMCVLVNYWAMFLIWLLQHLQYIILSSFNIHQSFVVNKLENLIYFPTSCIFTIDEFYQWILMESGLHLVLISDRGFRLNRGKRSQMITFGLLLTTFEASSF